MKCTEARRLFSSYMDGAATGAEMHEVSGHLGRCSECESEYKLMETMRSLVSSLGRTQPPADLALKIRLAISHESSRTWRNLLQSYSVRLENVFGAIMFPATVGLTAALLFFGGLIGVFIPAQAQSGTDDVPTSFYTPARLDPSSNPGAMLNLEFPLVIETEIDSNGQVQDYHILSGRDDEEIRQQLNRALLFTKFIPAQAFGHRVPGRAVISFSHVNVRG
ncbi:MAG TPA: zf-HC2 domain-containing protein [Verrucomicrobiae bacterium]|jgi:hypothetical protein|nr:zf-HC2 domain-containing protein [Verrucomicrobiae bacterium]